MRRVRRAPSLLNGAVQPCAAHLGNDLFVRDLSACITVGQACLESLYDVEVVQDVFEAAVVKETIEKRPNGVFEDG